MKSKSIIVVIAGIICILVLAQGVQATETYHFVTQWGGTGTGDGQFTSPYGIAADSSGNVYVSDGRIQRFTSGGIFQNRWKDIYMSNPWGLAVDSSGLVYDAEGYDTPGIVVYQGDGTYVDDWHVDGKLGQTPVTFSSPRGVGVNSIGEVYVVSMSNNLIQIYSPSGTKIGDWGNEGTSAGLFDSPEGIAVDNVNNVYVADTGNNRVQKFTSSGTFLTQWGSAGSGNSEFNSPSGIAVDSYNNVYVSDTGNNRVQKFTSTGIYLGQFGSAGSGNSQFNSPIGLAVDSVGDVYVADRGNDRIQKFALDPAITVTSPNGGEIWVIGTTHPITWTYTDDPGTQVDITARYGSPPASPVIIATGVPIGSGGSGSYTWTIPVGWVEGNQYVVEVKSSSQPTILDISNGFFTLYPAAPTFTSITQNSGPIDGGTAVTIVGSNFVAGGSFGVTIGGSPATNVIRIDPTHITAVTPAHGTTGAVDVVITNNDGQTATGTGAFTYVSGRSAAISYAIDKDFGGDPAKPENKEKELQVSDGVLPASTELKLGNGQTCPPVTYEAWVDTTNNNKNANLGTSLPPAPKQFKNTFYADGEVPVVCESDFPPIDLAMSHAAGNIPNSGGWTGIDDPPVPDPICANPVATNNYALLISGGGTKETNYNRYYNDIKFLYKTLINDYKYDPTHIRVLMSDGLNDAVDQLVINADGSKTYINSEQNLDGAGGDDVWGAADYNNISKALGSANGWSSLGSANTLLIFTTGHGAQVDTVNAATNSNQVNLLLWQASPFSSTEKITDAQFASLLPANAKIILVMEQCYGGGFKNNVNVAGKIRSMAAAALGSQQSHSNDFSYPWIAGASWHDSAGNPVVADNPPATGDGLIQTLEAFNYANGHDPSARAGTETPSNNPIGTGADALTLVTCGSGKSITNVAKTPTPWVAGKSGTVTWTATGLSGQNVQIDIMKGASPGVLQATFGTAKVATLQTSTATVPTVMTSAPGSVTNDYWLRITTTGTLRPPVIGTSGTFTITGVTGGTPATLTINTDSTGKSSLITIIDKSNGKEVFPGYSTPHTYSLPGGSYTVTLSRSCTIPMVPQVITLGSGAVVTKTYPLTDVSANDCKNDISTAEFGSIDISSLPANGYSVYLKPASEPDTRYQYIGSETPTIWNVLPGDWTVKLEAVGYMPGVQNVHVAGGDTVYANFELQPDPNWYTFTGFDAPVDMNGIVNTANAGRNIPLKWHLSDKNGYVSDYGKFKVKIDVLAGCSGSLDEIDVLDTTTGSSVITYQGNGAWHYNWKTDKADKGCKKVYVEYTSNGLKSPAALFKFK